MTDMSRKVLLMAMAASLVLGGVVAAEKGGKDEGTKPQMMQCKPADCPMKGDRNDGPRGPEMGGMEGPMGMGMGLQMKLKFVLNNPEIRKELSLTADQQAKLDAIQVDLEKFAIQKRADIQLLSVDLQQEFKKDVIDVKKVQDLSDRIASAGADLFKKNMTAAAETLNLLTKDQRAKLEEMRSERRGMMMKKFRENRR